METRLYLASYGVEEITIAEAQEVNGGIFAVIGVLGIVGTATGATLGWGIARLHHDAFTKGMRNACSICN